MELITLGSGSAFTSKNWQSNFAVRRNGKILLLDCGGDVRFALEEAGIALPEIDAVYVSHAHADHIGGIEWLGFCTLFNPTLKKPTMFGEANLLRELWTKSLVGGMEGLEGTKYIETNGDGVLLSTYFEPRPVFPNSFFVWEGIRFDIVQSVHIVAKYSLCNSFGLMWSDPDTDERVYLTTDTQYSPEAAMRAFYLEAKHIFQDCETAPFKSGVHANYEDLKMLPSELKAKMWLYHYQDNVIADYDTWNAKAITDGFRGFVKTGAVFARSYDKQEGGFVGSLRNSAIERLAEFKPSIRSLIESITALSDDGFSGDELRYAASEKARELGLI